MQVSLIAGLTYRQSVDAASVLAAQVHDCMLHGITATSQREAGREEREELAVQHGAHADHDGKGTARIQGKLKALNLRSGHVYGAQRIVADIRSHEEPVEGESSKERARSCDDVKRSSVAAAFFCEMGEESVREVRTTYNGGGEEKHGIVI